MCFSCNDTRNKRVVFVIRMTLLHLHLSHFLRFFFDLIMPTFYQRTNNEKKTQSGQFSEDMIPTVGFNMRKITKGNVTIKVWDIGGQPRFRSMWERYCRGVNAIV